MDDQTGFARCDFRADFRVNFRVNFRADFQRYRLCYLTTVGCSEDRPKAGTTTEDLNRCCSAT